MDSGKDLEPVVWTSTQGYTYTEERLKIQADSAYELGYRSVLATESDVDNAPRAWWHPSWDAAWRMGRADAISDRLKLSESEFEALAWFDNEL